MDNIAANLSSTQNSMFAEDDEDNNEDVWGMPKYQQNYSLENLTDEQYLARVSRTLYCALVWKLPRKDDNQIFWIGSWNSF